MPGLTVADVVNVQINMTPTAVPVRNFGALCIAGPSAVVDPVERIREYTNLTDVAEDFGSSAPEYLAADLFFSQSPQPAILYLARFVQTPSNAVLHGAIMSPAQQATLLTQLVTVTNGSMQITIDGTVRTVAATAAQLQSGAFAVPDQTNLLTSLKAITNGAFHIVVNGAAVDLTPINFTNIATLTDAATLINTGMGTHGTCSWNPTLGIFTLASSTTGTTSTITYASAPTTGTDISAIMRLTAASGALPPMNGSAGMNFASITNLNGAASIVSAALTGATCWFDGTQFHIQCVSTGTTSSIGYAGPAGTGTDISTLLGLTQASGAIPPVAGFASETPLACAITLRAHPEWYGLMFAVTTAIAQQDYVNVASFIEGANPISIFGYTTQDTRVLDPTITQDIASVMQGMNFERTFGQYSSSSAYAAASMYGRAFTTDFEANDTMITLKFKQEPGVMGEQLTENQAATLQKKNCNVFVYYSNNTAIIQEGVMANGYFFDEVQGTDWQANRIQTDLFDILYTSPTKIPQTNQGIHVLVTTVSNSLAQGVANGLIAPGQWNASGFGQIQFGQMLPLGYYVWAPLLETQAQSVREQRIAPTIQAAIKLAGAVHKANVIVNVNR